MSPWRGALAALVLACTMLAGTALAHEVDVVFSERHRPHVEAVRVLQQSLRTDEVRLFPTLEDGDDREEVQALKKAVARKPDLIVLVGDDALRAAKTLHPDVAMLSILAIRLHGDSGAGMPLTGVDLRPDPHEVASALSRMLPDGASVLTYYTPALSGTYIREAKRAFEDSPLTLDAEVWPAHGVVTALNHAMDSHEIYWMQLEERSATPDMLRLLFAIAGHPDKGLVGLSEKYVRAGALIAWTPEPEDIGFQAARMGNRILQGVRPQDIPIQHPERMKQSINRAARLHLDVPAVSRRSEP